MSALTLRNLGGRDYEPVWEEMKSFVTDRPVDAPGEIWLVEHNPVFTMGSNAKPEHLLAPGDIPVVPVDRGGQVTYHGPGQLVVYPLIYLSRTGLGVRDLVTALEHSVVDLLAEDNIEAYPRKDAPGVYVDHKKIASIGLRIKKNWSYHGLAINVDMDLEPFRRINPCGYAGMKTTQCVTWGGPATLESAATRFIPHLLKNLRYDEAIIASLSE